MRIEISECIANDSDAHQWLDRILHKISDGWHLWDTSELDFSAFETTTWVQHRGTKGDDIRELLRKSIKRGAWGFGLHNRRVRVTNRPNYEDEFCPETAARFAEKPLCILVENQFSDGQFVKRIVDELCEPLSILWARPGDPIQIYGVGGGGQMPDVVKEKMEGKPYRPRLVAIADSDKTGPSADMNVVAQKLRATCEEHNVPYWILAKRASENYLPRTLLMAWKPNSLEHVRKVEAWSRLSEEQKDYYNLKNGLQVDNQNPLFRGMSQADHEALFNGFGRTREKVSECWKLKYGETSVEPKLRERSRGDLERGIDLICKEV
ncbi:MAG: hypothetical protein OXI05_06485 [Bacteroidota bacterium]|nr:hypothetical protein [Bacteroidota bacterium]